MLSPPVGDKFLASYPLGVRDKRDDKRLPDELLRDAEHRVLHNRFKVSSRGHLNPRISLHSRRRRRSHSIQHRHPSVLPSPPSSSNPPRSLKVLNLWGLVLKDVVTIIMDSKQLGLVKIVLSNDVLANLICHGICVTLTTAEQIPDCLICLTGREEFDVQANQLKMLMLQSYTSVVR